MVDNDMEAGRQAVERAQRATQTNALGPGTAGYSTSGAAYRGKEIAASMGVESPAEVGFTGSTGLGYAEEGGAESDYPAAQRTR